MKISKYFTRSEFECDCGCGFSAVDVELLALLEDVREHFGNPLIITSACRCLSHNELIGGAKGSFHVKGMAADIVVRDVDAAKVQIYLTSKLDGRGGLGVYDEFTHVDVRSNPARWGS